MMPLTYVELFAGAGGMSRGLEMAGWACVAHAEWEVHARAVLRRHWPDTPLFGDVSTLTGQMIHDASGGRPVTMLTGGSPCQDLSIAGKRAGMTEDSGTRSSLYFDQVRLWHELNAISPCPYLLWENVLGALSSNHGKDFAAVLSALVGTPVAVPEDGWKGGGGVVSGCAGVAAWRVLDCQYFGPPQRRRRVFVLGVRAGGADPAEVLSLLESLSGHFESGSSAGQDTPPDAGSGVASGGADEADSGALTPIVFRGAAAFAQNASGELRVGEIAGALGTNSNASGRSTPMVFGVISEPTVVMPSLQAAENSGQQQIAVLSRVTIPIDTRNATRTSEPDAQNRQGVGVGEDGDPSPTLTEMFVPAVFDARGNGTGSGVLVSPATVFAMKTDQTGANGCGIAQDVAYTLDGANGQAVASVFDARGNGTGSVDTTLPGDHLNRITDYTPVVMRQREGKAGGGKGPLVSDKSLSLTAVSDQVLFTQQALGEYADKGVASSIKQRDHKDATDLVLGVAPTADDDALAVNVSNGAASVDNVMGTLGARSGGSEVGAQTRGVVMASLVRPRRLMPIECERLMGWPDRWTERGIDEQGREYALSDSARYKLCGNGVASPVAGWIGWRLRDTLEAIP